MVELLLVLAHLCSAYHCVVLPSETLPHVIQVCNVSPPFEGKVEGSDGAPIVKIETVKCNQA